MHNTAEPVTIRNRNGKVLFGLLQKSHIKKSDTGIVILSPGIKNRVGPHRLYVKMANLFNRLGYPVLRADPEGLGDSEGEFDKSFTADVYCSIELGLLVPDTITMMDFMEKETGVKKFILTGLCGGAITALLASEKDGRVSGILSLGMTCVLASSNVDPYKYITTQQLNSIREKYIRKIINPKAWIRFLSFQTDYRLLLKSLLRPSKSSKIIKGNERGTRNNDGIEAETEKKAVSRSNLNPHFHRTFLNFIRNNKILLIFSGSDRLYFEFEEKYMSNFQQEVEPYKHNYRIEIVKDANHVFSFTEWQTQMLSITEDWFKTNF